MDNTTYLGPLTMGYHGGVQQDGGMGFASRRRGKHHHPAALCHETCFGILLGLITRSSGILLKVLK